MYRWFLVLGKAPRSLSYFAGLVFLIPAVLILSCGIEAYHYLPPVPSGNITSSMNEQVTVALPAVSSSDFTHFVLYYRIYVSYLNLTGFSLSASNLRDINPALYSDYTYLSFYTSTSTTTTVNIASVMTNRNYQPLYFENSSGDISSGVLTSPGIQIQLHFPQLADQSNPPYLSLPGNSMMKLKRSNGGGAFTPIPQHRYFLNNDELNSDGNINTTVNADVAAPNVSGGSSNRYAYVAMYIATAGINEQTYTPIFSIPSFVGIFFLPNN